MPVPPRAPCRVAAIGEMVREAKTAARVPICPSMAARVTSIQCFCSPNCWRCIPHPDISIVVFSWKMAASSRIFTASMPQIPAAHSAVLLRHRAHRSGKWRTCRNLLCNERKSSSCQPFSTSVWAIPSIKATSVPMCGAIHSQLSPKKSTVSERIGSIQMTRLPLLRSASK